MSQISRGWLLSHIKPPCYLCCSCYFCGVTVIIIFMSIYTTSLDLSPCTSTFSKNLSESESDFVEASFVGLVDAAARAGDLLGHPKRTGWGWILWGSAAFVQSRPYRKTGENKFNKATSTSQLSSIQSCGRGQENRSNKFDAWLFRDFRASSPAKSLRTVWKDHCRPIFCTWLLIQNCLWLKFPKPNGCEKLTKAHGRILVRWGLVCGFNKGDHQKGRVW